MTNADLDHTLGLFTLREGGPLRVYTSPPVAQALIEGLGVPQVLRSYCGMEWHDTPETLTPLSLANGKPSGLQMAAFPVPGKWPRYMSGQTSPEKSALGFRLVDEKTGGKLVFVPDVASSDPVVAKEMGDCDLLLVDGTFWTDREMIEQGVGSLTAAQMAHWVVGGPSGSLATLKGLKARKKAYVHINNTNPMLIEGSKERAEVSAAGVDVGMDGMEFSI